MERKVIGGTIETRMKRIEEELEKRVRERMALKAKEAGSQEINITEERFKTVKSCGK